MIKKFGEFINELNSYKEPNVFEISKDEEISVFFENDMFYDRKLVDDFNKWLRKHREDYLRLYHGTGSRHKILEKGILTTTIKRRTSYQSENGYVYLSIYPDSAKTFGELGNPYDKVIVYSVDLKIKELKPDIDQLKNKRFYNKDLSEMGNTLAESLIYGHAARVKRSIKPYEINLHKYNEK